MQEGTWDIWTAGPNSGLSSDNTMSGGTTNSLFRTTTTLELGR